MKLVQSNETIMMPVSWNDIPCGACYRKALEQGLKTWWPKLFGFYLLKIGSLSAELDTSNCSISSQLNVGLGVNVELKDKHWHVIANPYQLPFANKSADACLLAHTMSYTNDPHKLLQEVDRVLIDDGWLVITMFNPLSVLGLGKIFSVLFRRQFHKSIMYTQMRLLDWLLVLNFEVLHRTYLQVLPWRYQGEQLLSTHFPAIGCLSLIVSRKRTFPLKLISLKNKTSARDLSRPANVTAI